MLKQLGELKERHLSEEQDVFKYERFYPRKKLVSMRPAHENI